MLDELQGFIKVNRLSAQIFEVRGEVHSAAHAAAEMDNEPDKVAKSIVLVDSNKSPVLVILLGKDRVDFQKLKKILNVSDVRLAEPYEVLEMTGFEVGGVPPVSIYGIRTIIDKSAAEKEEIVCGGGDVRHLMRIKVKEILENVEDVEVADVKK
ncbi:MAG TPA: YbaK/EbsC family protein [archaeon]|nr:YbaK/EbsC family protein [archaeon]